LVFNVNIYVINKRLYDDIISRMIELIDSYNKLIIKYKFLTFLN